MQATDSATARHQADTLHHPWDVQRMKSLHTTAITLHQRLAPVDILLEPFAGDMVHLPADVVLKGSGARVHGNQEEEEEEEIEDSQLHKLPQLAAQRQPSLSCQFSLPPVELWVAKTPAHVAGHEQ